MKKLILLLTLCVSFAVAQAQTAMNDGALYFKYAGIATSDTASASGAWNKSFYPNCTFGLMYNASLKITEVSATTSTVCLFRARNFTTGAWATLSTFTYRGTGSDTTVIANEVSTKKYYMEYNWLITPANGKVKVTTAEGKFWK